MSKANKVSHIGAPACFALEMACKHVMDAFGPKGEGRHGQTYVAGSSLERPDWRDVDVRLIMDDASFADLFPSVRLDTGAAVWEFDPRWTLITVSVTAWLRQQTGLPIDFQIQPMTYANEKHKGRAACCRAALRRGERTVMRMTRDSSDVWPADAPPGTFDIHENGFEGYPHATARMHFVCPNAKRCSVLLGPEFVSRPADGKLCIWKWDGSMEQPTLTPSINCIAEKDGKPTGGCGWHGFITAGEMK